MCGISGFYQSCFDYKKNKIWEERLQKMKNSLLHRGPDNNDIYIDSHIGLAHTRLSIIDLSSGHQPMKRTYNERSATIIFNGEIYNYCELKNLMSKKGASFITNSDTEVILMGYLMYGTSFFESLNGIFALAIYDNNFDELIIARDHLGVKPLFYQELNNSFVFASEQKGLFAYGIAPVLNQDSFKEVFGLGPARTPGHGIYSNMKELLPGSFMRISKCQSIMDANFCSTDKCYTTSHHFFWKLTARENKLDYNEACEYVSFLVRDSVTRQMISDIPICTFLSGGLDSSLVSSICMVVGIWNGFCCVRFFLCILGFSWFLTIF